MRASSSLREAPPAGGLIASVRELARPLRSPRDLDPLVERIGDARYVLLGEASHGTSEYYTWRTLLSQRLIEEKRFSFLAVEGDWPDCYRVNRYVKGSADEGESAREVLHGFQRWPTWMWANREVVALVDWLRGHNEALPQERKVGFYGLDMYSLWESLYAILTYLHRVDPSALPAAWKAFRCFEPYGEQAQEYARATRFVPNACEEEVVALLTKLRHKAAVYRQGDAEAYFHAEQNALIVAARFGNSIEGSVVYSTLRPCFDCTKSMLQAKVKIIYYLHEWQHPLETLREQYELIQNALPGGVIRIDLDDPESDWANGKISMATT